MDSIFQERWENFIETHKHQVPEDIYQEIQKINAQVGTPGGGKVIVVAQKVAYRTLDTFHAKWLELAKNAWERGGSKLKTEGFLAHHSSAIKEEILFLRNAPHKHTSQYIPLNDLEKKAETLELEAKEHLQNWLAQSTKEKAERRWQLVLTIVGAILGGLISAPIFQGIWRLVKFILWR
ncbi:MAG: hypothetical protein HYT79_06720 [Elusimicrobia bacterium]|nr:hypothetical protein [Elusimicrobiota bacterium]